MNDLSHLKGTTVLVTGATGFIGSHLVDSLLPLGCNVHCLVRKSSNLRWIKSSRVQLHFVDFADRDFKIPNLSSIDFVFHCAGLTKAKSREEYFDIKAAEAFAAAAKTHDMAKAGKASGVLGKTCGKCHAEQEISVWAKFHWPSFHKIKVTDPIIEKEIEFNDYMGSISTSFKGVTVNFGEGQYDRAATALKVFKSRYMELKSTCSKCHATQDVKRFYVGKNADTAFAGLSQELNSEKPNPGKFWKNIGLLGKTGCKHCHLVHRTNSFIQEIWEK